MKLLSIGLAGITDDIRIKLQQDCRIFAMDGFQVAVEEMNRGAYTFLGCNLAEGELSFYNYERIKSTLKNYVAKILADIVILREEKRLVRKLIDAKYYYFNDSERDILYDKTLQALNSNLCEVPNFTFAARHDQVQQKIQEYFENHHELVLEGFVNFRLKQYRGQLAQMIDKIVDDFVMELEYKEFIRVLRYFIKAQEPRLAEAHVLVSTKGTITILDEQGHAVKNQYIDNYIFRCGEGFKFEDILVSSLISLAPEHIWIHAGEREKKTELMNILGNIFEGTVAFCNTDECEFCKEQHAVVKGGEEGDNKV